jgi:hypothetical protein
MTDFVSATCDLSGQQSNECVCTHWYAAKEEGLVLKDTPGGWGPYGFSGARKKYSGLMDFKIHVCLPAIRDEIKKRDNRRILIVLSVILVFTLGVLLPGTVSEFINTILGVSTYVLCGALFWVGIIVLGMRARGFRARYSELEALSALGSELEKKIAWNVSKGLAWKKAEQAGLDTVWNSDRFEELEIRREDEWFFAKID